MTGAPTGPHRVVALVLPGVIAFDLGIPAQAFGHDEHTHLYRFDVCSIRPGSVPTLSPFAVEVGHSGQR